MGAEVSVCLMKQLSGSQGALKKIRREIFFFCNIFSSPVIVIKLDFLPVAFDAQ